MPKTKSRQKNPLLPPPHLHKPQPEPEIQPESPNVNIYDQYSQDALMEPSYSYNELPQLQPLPRTNQSLNLAVLRLHNPAITSILSIAPFAAVYVFSNPTPDNPTGGWEKTGIEGTLFVVSLAPQSSTSSSRSSSPDTNSQSSKDSSTGEPRFAVVILNRRGLSNFFAELRGEEDVEMAEGGIVIVNATDLALAAPGTNGLGAGMTSARMHDKTQATYGLWIFSDAKDAQNASQPMSPSHLQTQTQGPREMNARVMMECARVAEAGRVRRSRSPPAPPQQPRTLQAGLTGWEKATKDGRYGQPKQVSLSPSRKAAIRAAYAEEAAEKEGATHVDDEAAKVWSNYLGYERQPTRVVETVRYNM